MSMKLSPRMKFWGAIAVSLLVYYAMDSAIRDTPSWSDEPKGLGSEDEQMTGLVIGLFEEHVLALEVLGVLLTAAMIGAMVIARPLGQAPDKNNYRSDPEIANARANRAPEAATATAATGAAAATTAAAAATHMEEEE